MPTFTIRDRSSGKTITVRGDNPPTEAEMSQLFASTEEVDVAAQDERPRFTPTPYGVGGGVSVAPPPNLEEATAATLRYGVPAIAALGTGGASLLAQAGAGTLTSFLGELGARGVEGQDVMSRESLAEAGKSAAYNAIPLRRAAKIMETAGTLAGGAALAEAVGGLISGELTSQDVDTSEAVKQQMLKSATIASGIGLGLSGISRVTGRILSSAQESAQRRALLEEIGIDKPVLSQIYSEYAPITNRMAAVDKEIGNKIASTESQITKELFDRVGDIPTNSEIAQKVVPLMQKADEAELALRQANARKSQAKTRLDALEANPAQTADWQSAYEAAALEQLDAARKKAAAKFAAQQGFGDAASIASHADDLTRTIIDLDDSIRGVSSALYTKTGLNPAQPVVSREKLIRSARATLKDEVDSPVGQQIIAAIENVGKVGDEVPELISWNQFKNLRDEMATRLADFSAPYKGRSEALASDVYSNLGGVFRDSIKDTVGPEGLKAYDAAQKFWRGWTGTRDSNFTKGVFGAERKLDPSGRRIVSGISEATLRDISEGILKGEIQSIRNLTSAIDLVKKYSPEAANSMRASVGRSVRGALIDKYKNDPAGLIVALSEQASKADVLPFIQLAGFGSKKNLDNLAKVVRKYEKSDLTAEVIESALEAGDVVLGLGRGVAQKRAKDAAALAIVGASEKASKKLSDARNAAKAANLSADEANAVFTETVNNPLFSVFTGRGKYTFSEEAGKVGKGTISDFVMSLSPDAGQRFMGAFRQKDPQFADLISRKILADELYRISGIDRGAVDAATKIDFDKLRRLFNPTTPQDIERSKHLRLIVGDVFDTRIKTFLKAFEKASPELKLAELIKRDPNAPVASTLLGAAQPQLQIPGLSSLGAAVLATRIGRILEKPRFDLLTYMATDPNFLKIATKADKFSKAIGTLPLERTYVYLANSALTNDMADVDSRFIQPQPTR